MASYAFRAGGGPCYVDPMTGDHFHNYPDVVLHAPEFEKPMPAHVLEPSSVAAVNALRRMHHADVLERTASSLVIEHGHRRLAPHEKPPPAAYARVKRLAEAHGWTVTEYRSPTGHALQGRRGDLGFRAVWQWGKTCGATWHERVARWTLVADPRPVKVNALTRTGLKDHRPAGVGETRLKLLATPDGLPIKVTELEKRLVA